MQCQRFHRTSIATFLALAFLTGVAPGSSAQRGEKVDIPAIDLGLQMLPVRQWAQQNTADELDVFHDFQFRDALVESGIRFRHQIVDDAGKTYKMVHYDHGNGVAVADVDGDGLYDIYFTTQLGGNELWKNLGRGKFENITEQAGVGLPDRISVTASFADMDNDGDADLFVTTVRMGNAFFENDGKGRFRDVTEASGLAYSGHSSGAVLFDYDNDGRLDIFLTNVGTYTTDERGPGGYYLGIDDAFGGHIYPERTEQSILYKNVGDGSFLDVSEQTELTDGSWSGDATFVDLNQDGYPDLYVLNMQGDDHYYENVEGRKFVDKTAELFPKTPWGTMGVKFFDYNNDGRFDLMLTDMHSDMNRELTPGFEKLKALMTWNQEEMVKHGGANNIFGNAFYENQGQERFREISDSLGAETYWPWGLSVGDLNADGWDDVLVTCSMNFPWRFQTNSVLLNERGERFHDSEFILEVEPRQGPLKTPWFDLDCSGADRAHQGCRGRSGRVTMMGSVGSRSSVLFDLDDDGDLDIVTLELNDAPQVLVSNLARRAEIHYVKVKLVGTDSNRDGLGATVEVVAGGRSFTKYHDGKSGYLSQSSLPLYFGLGSATEIDRIEVRWPSGRRQILEEGLTPNSLIEIVEEG